MSVVKNPCKVYIGNIPRDADEGQIEKMFNDVGQCLSLEFKGDFAFVEYADSSAAEEAIRKYDGVRVRGRRLIVEPFRYRGGDPRYRRPPPKNVTRGEYRCIVTNLSSNTTAQDLRDWVEHEKLVSVTVTDVYNRHGLNEGVVEFKDKGDWDYAIRSLDHIKLDGHYVRVYDEREYNRRKLKVYDRPPPPKFRDRDRNRSRSWSKSRGNDHKGGGDDDRYGGGRNNGSRSGRGRRGDDSPPPFRGGGGSGGSGGGGGGREDYRERGRPRFRSKSPPANNKSRGDYRGGGRGGSGGGGGGRSRSRSRSRGRGGGGYSGGDNRRDRSDRYDRGGGGGGGRYDNQRGGDRGDRGDRYDRYDRR